jgi:uncharacterized repeat protein (TIGR02543 family)
MKMKFLPAALFATLLQIAALAAAAGDTVTVTLDPQGGSLGDAPATLTAVTGAAHGALPVPSRAGYAFAGWWTLPDGTGALITPGATVAPGETGRALYAKWKATGPAAATIADGVPDVAAAASDAAAGTWHFTGLDGKLTSATAGSAARVQGTVTVSGGGALAFSWDSAANQTLAFATDADAPERVKNATTALAASSGTMFSDVQSRAKLLKIDNDTWVLQTIRLAWIGSTAASGRAIVGVLHRDPLPAPDAGAWAKEFSYNSVFQEVDIFGDYETRYEGNIAQTVKFGAANSLWRMERAFVYSAGIYTDLMTGANRWDDSATPARNTDGSYAASYDSDNLGHVNERTWWEGAAFYSTVNYNSDSEFKAKWTDGRWYQWDDAWQADDELNDSGLLPGGNFYIRDGSYYSRRVFDKTLAFQLPGHRLASVTVHAGTLPRFNATVAVESPTFGGGDEARGSGAGGGGNGGGGNNNNGTTSGGGGAPALPALALLAALLALRARKKWPARGKPGYAFRTL